MHFNSLLKDWRDIVYKFIIDGFPFGCHQKKRTQWWVLIQSFNSVLEHGMPWWEGVYHEEECLWAKRFACHLLTWKLTTITRQSRLHCSLIDIQSDLTSGWFVARYILINAYSSRSNKKGGLIDPHGKGEKGDAINPNW